MANIIGKNCRFEISDASSEPARPTSSSDAAYAAGASDNNVLETLSNEVTLNIESNTDEVTPFGQDWEQHEIISGRWSVDITAYFNTGTDEVDTILVNNFFQFKRQRFMFWPGGKDGGAEGGVATTGAAAAVDDERALGWHIGRRHAVGQVDRRRMIGLAERCRIGRCHIQLSRRAGAL